jgi:hypothetical protein
MRTCVGTWPDAQIVETDAYFIVSTCRRDARTRISSGEPQSELNPICGMVRPFGAADTFPLSSTGSIASHGWTEHFRDGGSPGSLLLSADPDFDFWSELPHFIAKGFDGWVIQELRKTQAPGACVVGRSNDRFALHMLEGRAAARFLADTLEGSEIEERIRELAPDLELYSVGALFDGGTCLLLLPGPTGTTGDGASRDADVDAADPRDGLPRCVAGCSIWARKEFFRERGLEPGACHVSALLQLAETGEVEDVEILRGDAVGACGRALRDWAPSTRWEAAPGEPDRWFTVAMRPPAGDDEPAAGPAAGRFHTFSVPDASKHVLLVHPNPDVTLEELRGAYGSGLGPVDLVDEAHARSRTLCTVGRAADDRTVLRTDAVGPEVKYDPLVNGPDLQRIARISRDLRPELQWLIGDLLEEGGSCFLLRPLDIPG